MAAEKYVYKGGSMPKLFTEVDLADPDSLVAEAMRTPVNPIAAGEAKRRIDFLNQPSKTGGVANFVDA